MAAVFRRRQAGPPPRAGGGVDRKKSGIQLRSVGDDWVPPGLAGSAAEREPAVPVRPQDWLPPGLPGPTSQTPSPDRKRSTVRTRPPELAGPQPGAATDEAALLEELRRERAQLEQTLQELRDEAAAVRTEVRAATETVSPDPHLPEASELSPAAAKPVPESPRDPAASHVDTEPTPVAAAASAASEDRININTASAEELMRLPGVGERAAARIVAVRAERGPFQSVNGLLAVDGFHADRIKRLAGRVTV